MADWASHSQTFTDNHTADWASHSQTFTDNHTDDRADHNQIFTLLTHRKVSRMTVILYRNDIYAPSAVKHRYVEHKAIIVVQ